METTVPQTVLARLKTLTCVTKYQATARAKGGGKDQPVQKISMNVKILLFVKLIQYVKTQMDPILVTVMRDIHWLLENALVCFSNWSLHLNCLKSNYSLTV